MLPKVIVGLASNGTQTAEANSVLLMRIAIRADAGPEMEAVTVGNWTWSLAKFAESVVDGFHIDWKSLLMSEAFKG